MELFLPVPIHFTQLIPLCPCNSPMQEPLSHFADKAPERKLLAWGHPANPWELVSPRAAWLRLLFSTTLHMAPPVPRPGFPWTMQSGELFLGSPGKDAFKDTSELRVCRSPLGQGRAGEVSQGSRHHIAFLHLRPEETWSQGGVRGHGPGSWGAKYKRKCRPSCLNHVCSGRLHLLEAIPDHRPVLSTGITVDFAASYGHLCIFEGNFDDIFHVAKEICNDYRKFKLKKTKLMLVTMPFK